MMTVTWIGIIASLIAFLNVWPRLSFFLCFVCFLSFVTAAQDFSGYQSDGMLLEAGFIALFFAPRRPVAGVCDRPHRRRAPACGSCAGSGSASTSNRAWSNCSAAIPQWRHLTAMDEYYQNGPLPTWIGWYVQHLPHWFQAATVVLTLGMELVLVFMLFLPAARAAHLLLHRHPVGDRRHPHRQLRVPQLHCAGARLPAA